MQAKSAFHTGGRFSLAHKTFGGVGGAAAPLTAIVSGGFADGAGRFRLCRKHSLRGGTAVDGACAGHSDGAQNLNKVAPPLC